MNRKTPEYYIESDKFTDLSYETSLAAYFPSVNKDELLLESVEKIQNSLPNANQKFVYELCALEKNFDIYIFKNIKLIISIVLDSNHQDQLFVIFPSGIILPTSPTTTQESQPDRSLNTYILDTSCIGIALKRSSRLVNVLSSRMKDAIKNSLQFKKEIENSQSAILNLQEEQNNLYRNIEHAKTRLNNITNETKNTGKNLENLDSIIEGKEKEISALELKKQNIIEEKTTIDNALDLVKASIEAELKSKEDVKSQIEISNIELTETNKSINKLKSEIIELNQKKNLFDNELSGYNKEGKDLAKIYLIISTIILTILLMATYFVINSGIELIFNNHNMSMIDLLISRMPLTIGISILISMCFALSYFMIKQAIKINSDRMKFIQASIIAKDMWTACEVSADLNPQDREKLRQQAKIQLIAKILEDSNHNKHDEKIFDALIEKLIQK